MKHRRDVHLGRLKKIKDRVSGSSNTLDNTMPKTMGLESMSKDPRKMSLKIQNALIIERENKALLQRISKILTAPPKITDKEYQEMRK